MVMRIYLCVFVLGVVQVDYLGKQAVDSGGAQEHGCTNEAVAMLWKDSRDSLVARRVSIKVCQSVQ